VPLTADDIKKSTVDPAEKAKEWTWKDPILLAVVGLCRLTNNKRKLPDEMSSAKSCDEAAFSTEKASDEEKVPFGKEKVSSADTDTESGNETGKTDITGGPWAIFVCDRKKKTRTTGDLYYFTAEKELDSCDTFSQIFGYYVNALAFLSTSDTEQLVLDMNSRSWKYLGPTTTKVFTSFETGQDLRHFVLRSYDNRVHQTSRSPFLYEEWGKLRVQTTMVVNIVNEGRGDEEIMRFRDAKYYKQPTLFRNDGVQCQVKVIAIPFVEGKHHCLSVSQALSIVKELDNMQKLGFVHGDIRAFNIVFKKEDGDAEFIDFDFGGEEGDVNYPPGYVGALGDGMRIFRRDVSQRMEDSQQIEKYHDISALRYVLGILHQLSREASDKQICARIDSLARRRIIGRNDTVS